MKRVHKVLCRTRPSHSLISKYRLRLALQQVGKCNVCRRWLPFTFHVDHVIPISLGGSSNMDNLQALCANCHVDKSDMEESTRQELRRETRHGTSRYFDNQCVSYMSTSSVGTPGTGVQHYLSRHTYFWSRLWKWQRIKLAMLTFIAAGYSAAKSNSSTNSSALTMTATQPSIHASPTST